MGFFWYHLSGEDKRHLSLLVQSPTKIFGSMADVVSVCITVLVFSNNRVLEPQFFFCSFVFYSVLSKQSEF